MKNPFESTLKLSLVLEQEALRQLLDEKRIASSNGYLIEWYTDRIAIIERMLRLHAETELEDTVSND